MSDHTVRGARFHTTRGRAVLPDADPQAWFGDPRGATTVGQHAMSDDLLGDPADRVCQRAGCQRSATVTLSFRYDARQASLIDLATDKDPAFYDLCTGHADVLIVPRGWERLDRRTTPNQRTRAVDDAAEEVPVPDGGARADRYAALTAELPRLARACGLAPPARPTTSTDDPPPPIDSGEPEAQPIPVTPIAHPYEPVTRSLLDDEAFELEGQLQIPMDSDDHGVVVALTRTRTTT